MNPDAPTLIERYSVATETSNLRCNDKPGPIDIIAAAGMTREPAGQLFTRLRGEFDQAKAEVRHEAAGQAIGVANERMLIMMRLKSLKAAKIELWYMASARLTRRGIEDLLSVAAELSWQALSVWADSRCSPCGGTGVIGGYTGTPQMTCRKCDGGSRRGFVGKTDGERAFVTGLVGDIEEAMQRFESGLSRAMR